MLISLFNQNKYKKKRKSQSSIWYTVILTSCILSTILGVNQAAVARYKPPKNQKPPSGYSDSSGVRGRCNANGERSLTILAPKTHVGLTTSTHPTFVWVVFAHQSVPVQFSLYEFDQNLKPKKLNSYTQTLIRSPGLMMQSIPNELPGLSVGKRYLWQLKSVCNPDRPSQNLITRAEIEVVAVPQTLVSYLATTDDPFHKAKLYGKYGIWYDAIKEVLPFANKQELGKIFTNLLASLAEIEQKTEQKTFNQMALSYEE